MSNPHSKSEGAATRSVDALFTPIQASLTAIPEYGFRAAVDLSIVR